ncbi:5-histidylcysteine sulfoxide synthase [Uliginosibacterium sp. 31-16]|uniref:5-histidylcysteine sulfoxide synthase n=1 Tax=Uliginosibacterium sp. 31-16 TaxID=3068315 RepID=UPI00273EC0CC|nr:5-histidylcysteine sulfoxide synthase [Uliginosibacterium sp. 31-16]MDP5239320.1 5-histidylcysteine sulfoxide synthase [Uliginosibacterium sp. 31-16]
MTPVRFPRTPLLNGHDVRQMRQTVRDYFHATFDRYEQLFEVLSCDEAYYRKPITLRHPLIFYYGHTATFFINKLLLAGLITERINPAFESMCSVGVDEMSWDDLSDAHYDWPAVSELKAYRDAVRAKVDAVIANAPLTLPIDWSNPWWAILMGIEHERIHLETSSVLIRQHVLDFVQPNAAWQPCRETGVAPANELLAVAAGSVRLGKAREDARYGWDNEYGQRHAAVAAFQASRYLVSNQEFLGFVEAGGYAQDALWTEEGLGWQRFSQATCPTFWQCREDGWRLRLMCEEVPMPWDWPVEVNYHEAKAFCTWKSRETGLRVRLPSEDEWYRLYDLAGLGEVPAQEPAAANLHLDHWASSCPVTHFAHGDFFDVAGNVWQWTETPIYPFEGFEVHPIYDDFSTPTFDGRHNLIKGGSWIACGNESLRDSRYAFRRHFFQHAGFRYVVSEAEAAAPNVFYESDKQLSEYAEFHYGDEYYGVPNFPKALAQIAIAAMAGKPARTALDLGCATGRASFELARHFEHVTGVDFSARFINLGVQLAAQGEVRYTLVDEGELVSYKTRRLADLGLESVRDKVSFLQGDACNLKPILTGFDLILAANLIDRLYDPAAFLSAVHERLNIGGVLLIASPYTWLEEHTRREDWLGGFKKDGENFTTLDGLKALLGKHFRLMQAPQEVPFVIRETRRKFQHTLSEVTLWERLR